MTPLFGMLPVTVAVLKIVEPADAIDLPGDRHVDRAAGIERLDRSSVTCGAATVQPPKVPTEPLTITCDDGDARRVEALRAVDHATSSARRGRVVRDEDLVGQRLPGVDRIRPAPCAQAGLPGTRGSVGLVDREQPGRRARRDVRVDERGGVVQLVALRDRVVGIDDGRVGDGARRRRRDVALMVIVALDPWLTAPPSQVTVWPATPQTNRLVPLAVMPVSTCRTVSTTFTPVALAGAGVVHVSV